MASLRALAQSKTVTPVATARRRSDHDHDRELGKGDHGCTAGSLSASTTAKVRALFSFSMPHNLQQQVLSAIPVTSFQWCAIIVAEPVVQPDAHDWTRSRSSAKVLITKAGEPCAHREIDILGAEVQEIIFDLGRPGAPQRVFNSGANRVARTIVAEAR